MYIELAIDRSSWRTRTHAGRQLVRQSQIGTMRPKLGGYGLDWENGATVDFTEGVADCYRALFEYFLGFVCVPTACYTSHACTLALPIPLPWRSCTSMAHPLYPSTPCSGVNRHHNRSNTCYDLDSFSVRRQYCNGGNFKQQMIIGKE
jgi:hypothetical protein